MIGELIREEFLLPREMRVKSDFELRVARQAKAKEIERSVHPKWDAA